MTWSNQKKQEWLFNHLKPMVDHIYVPYRAPSMDPVPVHVHYGGVLYDLRMPPNMRGEVYEMQVEPGVSLRIPIPSEPSPVADTSDEVYNTNIAFVRSMMDFVVLDSIIGAGDVTRLSAILKRLLPLFVGLHSYRSKYSIEIINVLTKTEHMLSPRQGMAVKLRAFVNTSGDPNHNKPADMQQENCIKAVKNVVRALGAGKTDKAVVRASRAGPVISHVVEEFSQAVGAKCTARKHAHHKSDLPDVEVICATLRESKPFQVANRKLGAGHQSSSWLHSINKYKLNEHIKRNSKRAVYQIESHDDDDDGDQDD